MAPPIGPQIEARRCLLDPGRFSRELASTRWRAAVQAAVQAHSQKLKQCEATHSSGIQLVNDLATAVSRLRNELNELRNHRKGCEARMAADQARCQAFTSMLDESYESQLRQARERFVQECETPLAFIELLSAVQLIDTRQRLMSTVLRVEHSHFPSELSHVD